MTDDRQEDVAFEPVRIGRRRRGPDPFLIGVVLVIGSLALAVIKPWDGPPPATTGASASPVAVASTATESAAAPSIPEPVPGTILFDDPLATVTVLDALGPHDEWGILVVGRAPDFRTGYRERWTAAPDPEASGQRAVTLPVGEPTLAIGVTTPASETPLDVRVFRSDGDDRWTWLDVHRVTTDRPAGSLLLRPPRVLGVDQTAWPTGDYRLELLMGGHIATIDVAVPYPITGVPPPAVHLDPPAETGAAGFRIESIRDPGPVLMDGDVVMPIGAAAGDWLDPARAWLEARVSNDDGAQTVASVLAPSARTLAVMLPAGARGVDAEVSRVSPTGAFDPPAPILITDLDEGILPFVAFPAQDGLAWKPGTYAMHVRWQDERGRNDATWHVALLPGDPDPEPAMLQAARAFGSLSGRDGILVGPAFGLDARSGEGSARYLAFERPDDRADALPIACGETFIGGKPEVIGISHPDEVWTAAVTMALLVPGGETRSVPLRTAELRGLTLVEPARGASFAQGVYRIAIADEAGHMTVAMLCLGTSPFTG